MSLKKSVSLSKKTVDVLTSRKVLSSSGNPKVVWSTSINEIISNYDFLMKASLPRLTLTDWRVLVSTYKRNKGSKVDLPINIASDLLKRSGRVEIDRVKDTDLHLYGLIKKAQNFSQAQQMAVIDRINCYLSNQA